MELDTKFKERPILFSTPMVESILQNTKTQTRRIIKPQPSFPRIQEIELLDILLYENMLANCPYGKSGDRLWVRETWRPAISDSHECFAYKADNKYKCGKDAPTDYQPEWKPSIHMPRSACRLILEVSDVRVERLQDISEEDAIAEGIESRMIGNRFYKNYLSKEKDYMGSKLWFFDSPIDSFRSLWELINGANSWDANPRVWAIGFNIYGR